MLAVRPKETASLYTRDGVRLDADIYRPEAKGDFPFLLMRQPYGTIASTVVYAHPIWYAAQGYIVVIQDVRRRGSSGGTDLCAVLSQVQADGNVYNLTQGYIHVESSQHTPLRVSLQATCARILKGNALRLSLSASCFPAYPMNPGIGSPLGATRLMDAQIVTLTVSAGGDRPSQVLLPIVSPP